MGWGVLEERSGLVFLLSSGHGEIRYLALQLCFLDSLAVFVRLYRLRHQFVDGQTHQAMRYREQQGFHSELAAGEIRHPLHMNSSEK